MHYFSKFKKFKIIFINKKINNKIFYFNLVREETHDIGHQQLEHEQHNLNEINNEQLIYYSASHNSNQDDDYSGNFS